MRTPPWESKKPILFVLVPGANTGWAGFGMCSGVCSGTKVHPHVPGTNTARHPDYGDWFTILYHLLGTLDAVWIGASFCVKTQRRVEDPIIDVCMEKEIPCERFPVFTLPGTDEETQVALTISRKTLKDTLERLRIDKVPSEEEVYALAYLYLLRKRIKTLVQLPVFKPVPKQGTLFNM